MGQVSKYLKHYAHFEGEEDFWKKEFVWRVIKRV